MSLLLSALFVLWSTNFKTLRPVLLHSSAISSDLPTKKKNKKKQPFCQKSRGLWLSNPASLHQLNEVIILTLIQRLFQHRDSQYQCNGGELYFLTLSRPESHPSNIKRQDSFFLLLKIRPIMLHSSHCNFTNREGKYASQCIQTCKSLILLKAS